MTWTTSNLELKDVLSSCVGLLVNYSN